MSLEDHPGYFGMTSRGVIAIHADWPMYPFEHGWEEALLAFCSLPSDTRFFQIDDIDKCFLFVAGTVSEKQDPYDERLFHVATWREDMFELIKRAYVDGMDLVSEYAAAIAYWEKFKDLYVDQESGKYVPINLPKPENNDDSWPEQKTVPIIAPTGLSVSEAGRAALKSFLNAEFLNLPPDFLERVEPILAINKTDTAVREGCALLESTMRQRIGGPQFGQKLVDEFCSRILARGAIPALVKPFRAELKNAFRHIRNDYMHNIRLLELEESRALLMRIGSDQRQLKFPAGDNYFSLSEVS
jgi:hypothetical protein